MPPIPDTEINLDDLIDAIVDSIDAAFPSLATVEAYRVDRKELPAPACLITLSDFEAVEDTGTEQLPLLARFEAHIVVGFRTPLARQAAPKLAAAIGHHIRGRRWGQPVSPAQVTVIEPEDFAPELDQFEVWRIEWQQVVHIGASVWNNDGVQPTTVYLGHAPDIGPANEADYVIVAQSDPDP